MRYEGFVVRQEAMWRVEWRAWARRVASAARATVELIRRGWREFTRRAGLALNAPSLERQQMADADRTYLVRKRLTEEYSRGYLCGWQECFETCMQAIEDEIGALEEGLWEAPAEASPGTRADAALAAVQRKARGNGVRQTRAIASEPAGRMTGERAGEAGQGRGKPN
jgi:hypothetical protein